MLKGFIHGACAMAAIALALGGCRDTSKHLETVRVHHLTTGQYAYNNGGVWWWYVPTTAGGSPSSGSGSWQQGTQPAMAVLTAETDEVPMTLVVDSYGAPAPPAEAQIEAAGSPATEAPAEAGGDSVSFAGPTASTPSAPAEAGGGGGDAGGGDAGGGGGE